MPHPQPIPWDKSIEVGDDVLDAQHRHIVELINALYNAADGEGSETADAILHHVVRYLHHHFDTEEAVLRRIGYPDVDQHAAEHQRLMAQISNAAQAADDGAQSSADRFGETVWSWMHEHTSSWDQKYATALR